MILEPKYISTMVRHGLGIMPSFRPTEITNADLDALVSYLTRNNKQ